MSAFRIGNEALRQSPRVQVTLEEASGGSAQTLAHVTATTADTDRSATAAAVQTAADVYTKWIPGDVLAIFLALTTAFRGTLPAGKSGAVTPHGWGLLVTGFALAVGLAVLGGVAANLSQTVSKRLTTPEITGRAVLAALAFGFWSLTVPGAWWQVEQWNRGVLAATSFAISIVFALVAEITVSLLSKM